MLPVIIQASVLDSVDDLIFLWQLRSYKAFGI